jgi:zinc/manganese transport system substrate-binding protein
MRKASLYIFALFLFGFAGASQAALRAVACEPEWGALLKEIGGEQVTVFVATTAQQDQHRIEPRPSLIAKVRNADFLACTGAELEIGWLPVLLQQASRKVQPGQPGYFEAASAVTLRDVPARLDRALGDVHALGNPHLHTDPHNIARVAQAMAARLETIDAAHAADYRARHADFQRRWQAAIARWEAQAAPLRGLRLVAHHTGWVYLTHWLGIETVAMLEPRPGVPPSAAHLADILKRLTQSPARAVVRAPYENARPSAWLAQQAGIPAIELPYTVGGAPEATDLFALFDVTLARLLALPR